MAAIADDIIDSATPPAKMLPCVRKGFASPSRSGRQGTGKAMVPPRITPMFGLQQATMAMFNAWCDPHAVLVLA